MSVAERPVCAVHPQASAGWRCEVCGLRCPDCVGSHRGGTELVAVCAGCGGFVQTLKKHRASGSLADDLPSILAYPLQSDARGTLLFAGLGIAVLEVTGALGWLLAFCGKWAIAFRVLRDAARGRTKLEALEVTDFFSDLVVPGLTAVTAAAVPILPLFIYAFELSSRHVIDHSDPIAWLLGAAGAAYLPLTLIIAGTGTSITRMLNPVAAIQSIVALGSDYAIAAAATVALELGGLLVSSALDRIPYVGWLPVGIVEVYGPLVIGRLLGRLLYRRGDLVGYGRPEDYLVPLLAEAPRGTWTPPVIDEKPRTYEPIELDEAPVAIAKAMTEQRYDDALAVLKEGGLRPGEVDPAHLVMLAQRATGQGDHPLALAVLDSVVLANGAHPQAAKALVIAARIHAERLHDGAQAAALFRRVIARFPESEAARFAQSRLDELERAHA